MKLKSLSCRRIQDINLKRKKMKSKSIYKLAKILPAIFIFSLGVFAQAKLPPSSIKTVYITPTSHYDFGFVEPPDKIRERAARHIDEVIRMAETDPNFRWTIESVWQVNEWIKRQKPPTSVLPKDEKRIARLMNLIKSGRVALSTAWGSMHTDFMGAEELNRICYDYANLRRTYGIESQLAMMDDVPGHPTSIPSVLAGSGTKYLVTGANLFINIATSLAPGKVPFYWQSPDGSRVLTWVSQSKRGGYTEGMTDFYLDPYSLDPYTSKTPYEMFNPNAGTKTDLQKMEEGVTELLNRYNGAGYKYDAVMVMYAHDFVEPTNVANLEKAVKLWNFKHREIQLKISTPPEFLKYIETKYAAQIPTYKGEWSGLWSEAKTQSPLLSARGREAHDRAPASETLWSAISMTRKIPFPTGNETNIYDRMFTYDEHSGAGNTGWVQLNDREPLEEQNRQYVNFLNNAKGELDQLFDQGLKILAQPSRYDQIKIEKEANAFHLLVYNNLSWQRDDVARFKLPQENLRVSKIRRASDNEEIKFDVDEAGNVIFVAKQIPSFGYATFEIETATGANVSTLKEDKGKTDISNRNFRVKMRDDGSVESIFNQQTKREIVNNRGELPFNSLLRTEGSSASNLPYPFPPEISVEKGEQMTRIVVRRNRSAFPLTTLTIYDELDRAEIHNELDRAQMPFPGGDNNWSDSYYFAFPFAVSKNNLKVLRGGQKWFDRLPDDYLPGARNDSVTTQHAIGMTDGNSTAILAHRQAFHFVYPGFVNVKMSLPGEPKEFPAMFTGKFPLPEATIYSRAVRHALQPDTHDFGVVNFLTVEPDLGDKLIFDYAIKDYGAFDEVGAWRLGSNFNLPLEAIFVNVAPAQTERSFFAINQPNVEIVVVKPVADTVNHGEVSASPLDPRPSKIYIVRLQEFAGRAAAVQLSLPVKIKSAAIINLTEEKVLQNLTQIAPLTVSMKPYETKTVRVEIE